MNPIERAAEAMRSDNCPCEHLCYCSDWQREAQLAYEAIDTNQLANALLDVRSKEIPALTILGSDHEGDRLDALELALAVKNWLTGKDNQQ